MLSTQPLAHLMLACWVDESVGDFNQRQLRYYNEELPRDERHNFRTVKDMYRDLPVTKDKAYKMAPVPRPPGPPRP